MEQAKKNIKILFLHGYIQNGHIFEQRLKVITKKLIKKYSKTNFQFMFPDAPRVLKEQKIEGEIQRGWMDIEKEAKEFIKTDSANYIGLTDTIKYLYDIGLKNPDIDCIFSFSQASALVMFIILLSLYKGGDYEFRKYFPNIKCLVIASGFYRPIPLNDEFKDIFEKIDKKGNDDKQTDIPSLHVYGLSDDLLVHEQSQDSLRFFKNYEEYGHKGKHCVPSDKAAVEKYESFLEKYLGLQ